MTSQSKRQVVSSPINIENYPSGELRVIDIGLARKVGVNAAFVFHQIYFQHNFELRNHRKKYVQNECWVERSRNFWMYNCGFGSRRQWENAIATLQRYNMIEVQIRKPKSTLYRIKNEENWELPEECDD